MVGLRSTDSIVDDLGGGGGKKRERERWSASGGRKSRYYQGEPKALMVAQPQRGRRALLIGPLRPWLGSREESLLTQPRVTGEANPFPESAGLTTGAESRPQRAKHHQR